MKSSHEPLRDVAGMHFIKKPLLHPKQALIMASVPGIAAVSVAAAFLFGIPAGQDMPAHTPMAEIEFADSALMAQLAPVPTVETVVASVRPAVKAQVEWASLNNL